ncbi:hypothetical protein QYE76_016072 [Lolium multiflorum]|uniref:Reverse transcriptase domain-containing protein n=1 Tax=Lolium multiflorum TaxID=4521 RepID=A0AAD8U824_LOLMU|nr:hypothetical protein QYE76_016072 [Lolium multiflorum]
MDATFGDVHFIIDSGGFLRLPRTSASGLKAAVSEDVPPKTTLKVPPRSMQESNQGSFDVMAGRRKRRRDSYREEEGRTATHLRQFEQGCHDVLSIKGRTRSPYLSATEQLEAPCYLHSYIDPKDGREKSSHLLRNCRHFLEIRQFCDDLRAEAMSRVHAMERRAGFYSYPPEPYVLEPYVPAGGGGRVPTEVFPEPCGQVNMIHKTSFSKREIKKFSREVKYAEVAMVDTPDFIDWSDQSISFSRADHPKAIPRPVHAALILEVPHWRACLGEQIGRNIEVYIDDIVMTTNHAATLIDDLRETFDNLDKYKIKLNPKKCFFGVPGGQVLGYFISARGIEANPLKIKAILDMEPPKNLHQVQQLAGRLAALSRFIAKLGDKALPFYSLMKKSEKFEWTKEAHESFDNLKKILSTSPVLVTPREKETLLMYIAATAQVFSRVLVVEREEAGKVHGVRESIT